MSQGSLNERFSSVLESERIFARLHLHHWVYLGVALAVTALFLHSLTVGGSTWDELDHFKGIRQQVQFAWNVLSGSGDLNFRSAIDLGLAYYGLGTLLPAYAVSDLVDFLRGREHVLHESFTPIVYGFTFLTALATSWFVSRLVYEGTNNERVSVYAGIALLLVPPWIGYGFIDYKDVPLAAGVTACVCYAAAYVNRREERDLTAFFLALLFVGSQKLAGLPIVLPACIAVAFAALSPFTKGSFAVLTAFFLALLFVGSQKLAGLPIVPSACIAVAIAALLPFTKRGFVVLALHSLAFVFLLYLITPPAWVEPLQFFVSELNHMAVHDFGSCTLTAGKCIGRNYHGGEDYSVLKYLSLWYAIQLPVLLLLATLTALVFYLRFPNGNAKTRHLVAASIAWPCLALAVRNSTLYNGIRHTIFFVPLIVAFCFVNIPAQWWIAWRRWLAAYGIFLFIDMIAIHPNGYVWFNEPARLIFDDKDYLTDYWYYSLREAVGRLQQLAPDGSTVSGRPEDLVLPYVPFKYITADFPPKGVPFFYLSPPNLPACPTVERIERRQLFAPKPLTLSHIGRCVPS